MTSVLIQVRGVDSGTRDILAARAARRGLSLTAFLRELLEREAATPQLEEVFDRIERRAEVASVSSLDIVRRDRGR